MHALLHASVFHCLGEIAMATAFYASARLPNRRSCALPAAAALTRLASVRVLFAAYSWRDADSLIKPQNVGIGNHMSVAPSRHSSITSAAVPLVTPAPAGVPLLDVNRQYQSIRSEIAAAIRKVCDSGRFVLGPDCEQLENSPGELLPGAARRGLRLGQRCPAAGPDGVRHRSRR